MTEASVSLFGLNQTCQKFLAGWEVKTKLASPGLRPTPAVVPLTTFAPGCYSDQTLPAPFNTTQVHADVARFTDLIRSAKRAVCFTGAGISTESGIPDFRSPGGMWSRMPPIEFQDFVASEEMRREAWRRKLVTDRTMRAAEPNRGHRAVAQLVRQGVCACVITQNIDGLHQRSGVPDDKIVELHGNSTYAACLDCALRHELDPILAAFEKDETLPICARCGGMVKTATISFGQRMPLQAVERAEREALASDLFIVLGSSLVVFPAANLPRLAKRHGAYLVIVNRELTDQDGIADLVIHADIGPTIGAVVGVE